MMLAEVESKDATGVAVLRPSTYDSSLDHQSTTSNKNNSNSSKDSSTIKNCLGNSSDNDDDYSGRKRVPMAQIPQANKEPDHKECSSTPRKRACSCESPQLI